MIRPEELREHVSYDAGTGLFSWRIQPPQHNVSTPFSTPHSEGYLRGFLLGARYYAHRAAWAWMNGEWPAGQIDHINGNRADNRWANLRDVPRAENQRNMRKRADSCSVAIGVSGTESGRWRAHIGYARRLIHLGTFQTFDEALAARKRAERRYGFHPNHGRTGRDIVSIKGENT